ncbi:MAG: 30S ribosomal protein S7 [Candidatus Aenigmatarchaeota archaeon]
MSELKLFGRWDWNVEVKDAGLKRYINLNPIVIPRTYGRYSQIRFGKEKMNIVERLITRMMVPGHKGKKHLISSARCVGKTDKIIKIIKETLEIIESKTKKNPIEVLVRAIENSAPLEEPLSYQIGGIIARTAVIISPQRRVDIAIRNIVNSCYRRKVGFAKMKDLLAEEIIAAANNDISKSYALKERERIEKEAEGAR